MKLYKFGICAVALVGMFALTANTWELTGAAKTDNGDSPVLESPRPPVVSSVGAPDSFQATRLFDGRTDVEWHMRETNRLAFRVYREENGQRVQISPLLTPGSTAVSGHSRTSDAVGHSYTWWDRTAPRDGAVSYWLEYVNAKNQRNWVGPVVLVAREPRGR